MNTSLLSADLSGISYPPQLRLVDQGIGGLGFYPGCRGFAPGQDPSRGIMLLGRDFGTAAYYDGLAGTTRDETALTWRHTREIYLKELAGVPVWCTNYLMGIRRDGSANGNLKLRVEQEAWRAFESSCWGFLQKQVVLQKPRVIVVFGVDTAEDLRKNGRLGLGYSPKIKFAFQTPDDQHETLVTFADHPHSLIRTTAKDRVRIEIQALLRLYRSTL